MKIIIKHTDWTKPVGTHLTPMLDIGYKIEDALLLISKDIILCSCLEASYNIFSVSEFKKVIYSIYPTLNKLIPCPFPFFKPLK